jgi:hypothetical protein
LGNIRQSHNLCLLAHTNLGVCATEVDNVEAMHSTLHRAKEWWADLSGIPTFESDATIVELIKSNLILAQTYMLRGHVASAWASLNMASRVATSSTTVDMRSHSIHVRILRTLLALYGGESSSRLSTKMLQIEDDFSKMGASSECRGVFYTVQSILHAANGNLEDSIQFNLRSSVYFERAEASMFLYGSIVHRGWLHLLSGNFESAQRSITEASQLALTDGISEELSKWVVELKVVYNCCKGDMDTAITEWEQLRPMSKRDIHSATSSALMSHILVLKEQWVEAIPYVKYACTRLSQKVATSIVSVTILFLAGHSVLTIIEEVRRQVEACSENDDLISTQHSDSSNTTQSQNIVSAASGRRIIAQLEPRVDIVIDALRKDCANIGNAGVLLQTLTLMRKRVIQKSAVAAEKVPILEGRENGVSFFHTFYSAERDKCGVQAQGHVKKVEGHSLPVDVPISTFLSATDVSTRRAQSEEEAVDSEM